VGVRNHITDAHPLVATPRTATLLVFSVISGGSAYGVYDFCGFIRQDSNAFFAAQTSWWVMLASSMSPMLWLMQQVLLYDSQKPPLMVNDDPLLRLSVNSYDEVEQASLGRVLQAFDSSNKI